MSATPNPFEQGGGMANPMTTQGDLIFENSTPAPARLGIGSSTQVLTVVGGNPAWAPATSGFANPMTTQGDLLYENATPAAARLPIGTSTQVLTVSGGLPVWSAVPGGTVQGATTVAASAITTTALTDVGGTYTVPANTPASGVSYELHAVLGLTALGTPGSNTATLSFYWGGIGGTQLANYGTLNTGGMVFGQTGFIEVDGYVRFTSTTAASSYLAIKWIPNASTGGYPIYTSSTISNNGGLTTTSNQVLTCGFKWSAIAGSPSITPEYGRVTRVS